MFSNVENRREEWSSLLSLRARGGRAGPMMTPDQDSLVMA